MLLDLPPPTFGPVASFAGMAAEVVDDREPCSKVHSPTRFRRGPGARRQGGGPPAGHGAARVLPGRAGPTAMSPGDAASEVGSGIVTLELRVNVQHGVGLTCSARDGKVFVKGVEPGSPAHAANVRAGWQIFSVNGTVPHSIRDVAETLKAFRMRAGLDVMQVLALQVVAPLPDSAGALIQAERDCILAQYEALHKIHESRRHMDQRRAMRQMVERERQHRMM